MNRHGVPQDRRRLGPRARALQPRLRRPADVKGRSGGRKGQARQWDRSRSRSSPKSRCREVRRHHRRRHDGESSSTTSPASRSAVIIESRDLRRLRASPSGRGGRETKTNRQKLAYFPPGRRNIIPVGRAEVSTPAKSSRRSRETTKTKDITGGLPRVAELFEARKPKDHAIVAEIDGTVTFGKGHQGKRKVLVTPEAGETKNTSSRRARRSTVKPGDFVPRGRELMDGPANPHDIPQASRGEGARSLARQRIQQVYRLRGVGINDKHIETIVRQMLRARAREGRRRHRLPRGRAGRTIFRRENEKVIARARQARRSPSRSSSASRRRRCPRLFISASSFQGDDEGAHRGGHSSTSCAASRRTSSWDASCRPVRASARTKLDMVVEADHAAKRMYGERDAMAAASDNRVSDASGWAVTTRPQPGPRDGTVQRYAVPFSGCFSGPLHALPEAILPSWNVDCSSGVRHDQIANSGSLPRALRSRSLRLPPAPGRHQIPASRGTCREASASCAMPSPSRRCLVPGQTMSAAQIGESLHHRCTAAVPARAVRLMCTRHACRWRPVTPVEQVAAAGPTAMFDQRAGRRDRAHAHRL